MSLFGAGRYFLWEHGVHLGVLDRISSDLQHCSQLWLYGLRLSAILVMSLRASWWPWQSSWPRAQKMMSGDSDNRTQIRKLNRVFVHGVVMWACLYEMLKFYVYCISKSSPQFRGIIMEIGMSLTEVKHQEVTHACVACAVLYTTILAVGTGCGLCNRDHVVERIYDIGGYTCSL